jgi:hypothetical protein
MVSSKKDVSLFLEGNDLLDIKIVDNYRVKFIRILYRLNYVVNVILCNKLNFYSNHFFIKSNLLKNDLKIFDNIFVFYIFPAVFLNLSSLFYNSQNVFIDTNDILVDRHNLISKRTWFSVNKNDQDIFNKANVFFVAISELDYLYYSKMYSNVIKLFFIDLNKYNAKQNGNLKLGFISSNSELNREDFIISWNNKIFHKLRDAKIELLIFGSINSFLIKNNFVLDNMQLLMVDDIDFFYSKIDILFSPIGPSTGIKTKVIEALMSKTKVITTKFGYDESLSVFMNNITLVNYPVSYDDLIYAIKSHRKINDINIFSKINDKYVKMVNYQFSQLINM